MNSHSWNFRREAPATVPGAVGWPNFSPGPRVIPGEYTVRLTVGETVLEQPLIIAADPRLDISESDWAAQDALLNRIYTNLDRTHEAVNMVRDVRGQIDAVLGRAKKAGGSESVAEAGKAIKDKLADIENALIQVKSKSAQDPLNFPVKLNDKIKALMFGADTDGRPSQAHFDVMDDLERRLAGHFESLESIKAEDVPEFNRIVQEANVPAIIIEDDDENEAAGVATAGEAN